MKSKTLNTNILNNWLKYLIFFLFGVNTILAQDNTPLDQSIRYGKLSNGLTYYIKSTKDNLSKMNAYLLVKAGSANLDSDQYQLEHFLEHVALKAGSNMTSAKAMQHGFEVADIQANTSIHFTQYFLTSINTLKKKNVAFNLFSDIIWNIDFRIEYIDSERPILINEMAVRKINAPSSIMINMENSMIGNGVPRPENITNYLKTFSVEPLKRFYKDWYRPDLMAIILIGDVENISKLENEIITKFSKPKHIINPRSITSNYNRYKASPSQFIKKENPLDTKDSSVYLNIYIKEKSTDSESIGLRNEVNRNLFISILHDRFKAIQASYGANFKVLPEFLLPPALGLKLESVINDGNAKAALKSIVQVMRELKINGLSESQFKKYKENYLLKLSLKDTTKTSYWWTNIRDHFIYGTPLPTKKGNFLKSILSNLDLKDFNYFIKNTIDTHPDSLDIIMLAPQGHQALNYSKVKIKNWIEEANYMNVTSYRPPVIPDELISSKTLHNLLPGAVRKKNSGVPRVHEYRLENGMKLILNSMNILTSSNTKRKNDIRIHGFTPKGVRCFSKVDYFSVLNAADIVKNSGVGGLNKFELNRYLKDKRFGGNVMPYTKYDESGIIGRTSVENLEIALQLIYLYFTHPNKNRQALEDWKLNVTTYYTNSGNLNALDFKTKIRKTLRDSTYLPEGTTMLEGISKLDLDRAFQIYKNIFGHADEFTFVITGDFPTNKVLLLCRKYLGNLPTGGFSSNCPKAPTSTEFMLPKSHAKTFRSTLNMREVLVQLIYTSKISLNMNWKKEVKMLILWKLLQDKIGELRFERGAASYTMRVGMNTDKSRLFNEIYINYSCMKEDADELASLCKQVIKSFLKNKVNEGSWDKNLSSVIDYWERRKNNPPFMTENLYNHYRYDYPFLNIEEIQDYLSKLTPKDIKRTAQHLLKEEPFEFAMTSKIKSSDLSLE